MWELRKQPKDKEDPKYISVVETEILPSKVKQLRGMCRELQKLNPNYHFWIYNNRSGNKPGVSK